MTKNVEVMAKSNCVQAKGIRASRASTTNSDRKSQPTHPGPSLLRGPGLFMRPLMRPWSAVAVPTLEKDYTRYPHTSCVFMRVAPRLPRPASLA
jgi:hypothetical protein